MVSRKDLNNYGRAYILAVIVYGLLVIGASIHQFVVHPIVGYQWFLLAGLTLVSGSATVKLPGVYASITISEVFVFTAVLLYGPAAGTLIVALDGLVSSFWIAKRHTEAYRPLFNMSAPAVSAWWSATLFFKVADIRPLIYQPASIDTILFPLVIFAVAYFTLNSWFIALAIAFEKRINPFRVWPSNFIWLSLNYFSGASVAVLLVVYNRHVDLAYVSAIVPLLLVLYFTFKTSWARVEDTQKHLEKLNALYLSTIETLAMAIDAKDQITHGHIRRVQSYAVGLAKRLGAADEHLIKAIEAAALLHDMGKLAVPEYILNKPGKLTKAEFEKMKLHASVGADILSAIDFPYPVVPIVRHHHENWDGTGYPQGLKGTDIPVGARILAVVDCFDALTSDRPYRPRLANEEALAILTQRRGTMYDPLIVDTFMEVHSEIAPNAISLGPPRSALNEITSSSQAALSGASPRLDDIAASADEMLTLYELARALTGQASISDTGDIISKHLKRLVPSSLCVFYLYDTSTDELEARHATGDETSVVKHLRIPLGQRLSGWVAANRQTIVNADPILDLGEVARCMTPRLRSCLSTPMTSDGTLIGVLTLYSATVDAFTEDHRRVIEAVARHIADTFKGAAEFENAGQRDPITGLPYLSKLEHLVASLDASAKGPSFSLVFIDVVDLKGVNVRYGRSAGDEVLRHVVKGTRQALRVADIVFRFGSDEFVVLLNETNPETAETIASTILARVHERPVVDHNGTPINVEVSVTSLHTPKDGESLHALLASARTRAGRHHNAKLGSVH